MSTAALLDSVNAYYSAKVGEHGATPRGVDWNSSQSQETRFAQLMRVCERDESPYVLGDYGCGYGALLDYVRGMGSECEYRGYDISENMIRVAAERHGHDDRAAFATDEAVLGSADYLIASGIFNVKLGTANLDWEAYVLQTLDGLAERAGRGFAFNVLTSYSDLDRQRPDLYYADPCFLFDRCKKRYSRHVSLLHGYGLYEFTMLVNREPA